MRVGRGSRRSIVRRGSIVRIVARSDHDRTASAIVQFEIDSRLESIAAPESIIAVRGSRPGPGARSLLNRSNATIFTTAKLRVDRVMIAARSGFRVSPSVTSDTSAHPKSPNDSSLEDNRRSHGPEQAFLGETVANPRKRFSYGPKYFCDNIIESIVDQDYLQS